MELNRRTKELCHTLVDRAAELRARVHTVDNGATLIDLGIETPGGLGAGLALAEICLAGLGRVSLVPGSGCTGLAPAVAIATDHPVAACMASQYAGWQITGEKYFAMGSGPMRAAYGREPLFERLGHRERPPVAVGVLETRKFPPLAVIEQIASGCGLSPDALTLLVAPTASLAGTVQVVARSVETSLHKLFELGFDLMRVESAWGIAPLPPVAGNDLAAIGLTNDAILYGGEVTLWVRGDDDSLATLGPQVPSSASSDHGLPFAAIFERAGRNFYDIDPHLFSPAVVTFQNLDTGRVQRFGRVEPEILARSFGI
jgi:methenyltetrahydromethanopterin cyclohydrolase